MVESELRKLQTILANFNKSPNRRYLRSTVHEKQKITEQIYKQILLLVKNTEKTTAEYVIKVAEDLKNSIITFIETRLNQPSLPKFKTIAKSFIKFTTLFKNSHQKMAFDIKQASTLVEVFDGNPEKTEAFVDAANLLIELTPANQHPTLFKFLKTRLAGQARQALQGQLNDDPALLVQSVEQKCVSRQTPETIIAKMKNVKQRGQADTFCNEIETLTTKLNSLYVQQKIPADVACKMATKAGVESLIAGTNNPEIKLILKASSFNTIGDAIQKTLENCVSPTNSVLHFTRNRNGPNGRGRGNNFRSRGRRGYYQHGQTRSQNNHREYNNGDYNFNRGQNRGRRGNHNHSCDYRNVRQIQAENDQENAQAPQRANQNALPLREARQQ